MKPCTGLDPKLLDQHLTSVAISPQRIGLATAAIEREHQLCVRPLTPRMLAGELLQLTDQLGMPPRGEVGLDAKFQGRKVLLLQARDLSRCKRRRAELL